MVTGPHGLDARAQPGRVGQAQEQPQTVVVDALAGEVVIKVHCLTCEARAALRIGITQCAQRYGAGFSGARLQGTPVGGQFVLGHR